MRERPRINLHKLGNAFLGDPATHFIRRRQFAALFPGFESAARAHDQLARWKSLFWPFSLTVTVRDPLKFTKNLGVDRVVVPCQLSLGRVWIRIYIYFAEVQDIRFSKILVLTPLGRYDLFALEPG